MRTITMTNRRPIRIDEKDWPVIAEGNYFDHDNEFVFQANRKWSGSIKVRAHADGRIIVYGVATYSSQWQGEKDYVLKGGMLLDTDDETRVPTEINRVAGELIERGADERMRQVAHDCIASLPAEEI